MKEQASPGLQVCVAAAPAWFCRAGSPEGLLRPTPQLAHSAPQLRAGGSFTAPTKALPSLTVLQERSRETLEGGRCTG